jgi:multidrug efflux system membrane fusion protein
VKVVFGVPDVMVDRFELGSSLQITSEAFPGTVFTGRISRVSPYADPKSRVFEVEATIPNPKQTLKTGMIASLKVPEGAETGRRAVVVLPLNAIVRPPHDPAGYGVFVVETQGKSVAHARTVKLGELVGNGVLVQDGLKAGESVVVQGATLVADGEEVQVIP